MTSSPRSPRFSPTSIRRTSRKPRLRVVSNFRDSGEMHARAREDRLPRGYAPRRGALKISAPPHGASPRGSPFSRARVYFAGITKIRDYSQSMESLEQICATELFKPDPVNFSSFSFPVQGVFVLWMCSVKKFTKNVHLNRSGKKKVSHAFTVHPKLYN